VAAIEAAFAPSSADIAEAEEALAAYREGGERAIRFKGRMLEAPLVKRYRAVLAQAKEAADA
jgi:citrate lyase subunit beta/citryl-CoA lyase/(S)-citramalyl-CoA lyase